MAKTSANDFDYEQTPFPLTAIDREILATKDEDYHRITWEDLRRIIANNSLEQLKRLPSDLRRYLAWSYDIKQRYNGITNFVIQERLHWTPDPTRSSTHGPVFAHESATPFAARGDYAVLANDWPYGFEAGIVHLLVWSKTPIAVDEVRGDVTAESRRVIEEFVEGFFVKPLVGAAAAGGEKGRVQWFKNWVSLQSVRGVDHVHVLVKDAPEELIERWTAREDL